MEDLSPRPPLHLDEALGIARGRAPRPDSVRHFAHHELESARHGRGFAFLHTIPTDRGDVDGYVLVTEGGGYAIGLLSPASMPEIITEHLAKAAHDNRDISFDQLGLAQRLAVAAFDAGAESFDDTTLDYANYLLLAMMRSRGRPGSGRAVLARNDQLLRPATPGRRYTHPCPCCGRAALHQDRYPRSVCDSCHQRTTDRTGRRITGSNTSMSGGFVAHYADSPREECVEVTRTGRCYIDGREAVMGEARFGGIVVEAVDDQPPP